MVAAHLIDPLTAWGETGSVEELDSCDRGLRAEPGRLHGERVDVVILADLNPDRKRLAAE